MFFVGISNIWSQLGGLKLWIRSFGVKLPHILVLSSILIAIAKSFEKVHDIENEARKSVNVDDSWSRTFPFPKHKSIYCRTPKRDQTRASKVAREWWDEQLLVSDLRHLRNQQTWTYITLIPGRAPTEIRPRFQSAENYWRSCAEIQQCNTKNTEQKMMHDVTAKFKEADDRLPRNWTEIDQEMLHAYCILHQKWRLDISVNHAWCNFDAKT